MKEWMIFPSTSIRIWEPLGKVNSMRPPRVTFKEALTLRVTLHQLTHKEARGPLNYGTRGILPVSPQTQLWEFSLLKTDFSLHPVPTKSQSLEGDGGLGISFLISYLISLTSNFTWESSLSIKQRCHDSSFSKPSLASSFFISSKALHDLPTA